MTERTKPGLTARQARIQKVLDGEARLWPQLDTALGFVGYPERYAAEVTKAMETAVALVLTMFPMVTGRQAHPERVTRLKGTPKPAAGAPDKYAERMAALHALDEAFVDVFDDLDAAGDVSQEELNGYCGAVRSHMEPA